MDQKYLNNQKQLEIRQRKGRGEGMRKNHNPLVKAAILWLIKFVGSCQFAFYLATFKSYTTGHSKPKSVKLAIEWPSDDLPHASLEAFGNSCTGAAKETERQVLEETRKAAQAAKETTSVVEKTEKSAPVFEKITATKQLHQKRNNARLQDMNLPIAETRTNPLLVSLCRGDPNVERYKVLTSFSDAKTAGGKMDLSSGYTSDHSYSLPDCKHNDPRPHHPQQPHVPGMEHHANPGHHRVPFQSQSLPKPGTDALLLGLQDTGQSSRVSGAGNGQPLQATQPLDQVLVPPSPKDEPTKRPALLSREKAPTKPLSTPKLVNPRYFAALTDIPSGPVGASPAHHSTVSFHSTGDDPPGIPQEEQQQQQWQQEQQPVPPPVVAQAVDESNREICFSEEESGTSGTQGPGW